MRPPNTDTLVRSTPGAVVAEAVSPSDEFGLGIVSRPLLWAIVAAATVVGVALRVALVGDQSLGYEEVFTSSVTDHATLNGVWQGIKATESTPPLYYLLTWLSVKLSGDHSAVALRMVSLVAGSVTVPVAFLAIRRFVGDRLAVVAAWLFAISPLLVEFSIYARSYAVLVVMMLLSLWALGALLERPSWPRWLLWGAAAVFCVWTHYFAPFLLAAEVAVLFVKLPRERRRLLLVSAAAALSFVPLWPLLRARSSSQYDFIRATPLTRRLEDVVRQFAMGTNVPYAWLEGLGILLVASALVIAVIRARRTESTRLLVALAVMAGGLPVLLALGGNADYLKPRNIIAVSICLAPLAAYGLTRWRSAPLVAYSVVCVAAILIGQTDWRYQGSPDWAGVGARIQTPARGVPVAVMPGMESDVAGLYLHRRLLSAPVQVTSLWVLVEPTRGAHQRALTAVPNPPLTRLWGPAFQRFGEIDYRGFRMIHLQAAAPTVVTPAPTPYNGPAKSPLAFVLAP
jgi:4-amino-4-deoxy-L-arabinose transferase-like glycosyltransferase